ncbi:uncharacterized protein LOC131149036 [Malania oleifera]|uniref:uncharacterized protein LOC131149036 n=1 Tax=Malania oleifera TaxID=397392 RepID=UPI0025ADF19E|nr:uncharacterized protein LOC131149036 [Malania oleifera]
MSYSLCFSRNSLPWIAAVVPFMVVSGALGFGFLSILLTSSVLIFSILLALSKQKPELMEESVKEEFPISDRESLPEMEEVPSKQQPESNSVKQEESAQEEVGPQIHEFIVRSPDMEEDLPKQQPGSECVIQKKYAQEAAEGQSQDYTSRSSDLLSESEGQDRSSTSEDSELEWPFRDNAVQSPEFSDGSISDEDSLIEIALPSGHYLVPKEEEEEAQFNFQQKLPSFSPASIFQQQSLLELLSEVNEMNEEENLIEIDISMGSIKCSRFEIEA